MIVMIAVFLAAGYLSLFGVGEFQEGSIHDVKLGLDLAGGVSITYQAVGDEKPSSEDMDDTVYKLQRRVEQYSTEAQVYKEGEDRITIEIPGVTDANTILEELGKPGSLYFIRETDDDGNANYSYNSSTGKYELTRSLDEIIESGDAVLSGTDVTDAQAGYQTDSMNSRNIVVELTFTDEGKQKFADATKRAYANDESIGIYYDGEFISVPHVQSEITNGQAVITGETSIEDAQNLASTIRIGGLSVELEELRSNVVGAQLGESAIETSLLAAIVGLILIFVLMIAVYWLPGICASIALLFYCFLEILVINAFEVTLTLPGIAGVLLSIGMAVDANVIVFARIREELATGKTVASAMKIGYSKALSAIIDGNVTTLIAAFVLMAVGSGTVKGFGQTLAIGIILSMFTSLFVTKWLMTAFLNIGFSDVKWYGVGKQPKQLKILENRKKFFLLSGIVICIGLVTMCIYAASGRRALNYSLDFVGGTSTNVTFDQSYTLDELEADVVPVFEEVTGDSSVQVQTVQNSNEVIFKTRSLDQDERESLQQKLIDKFGITEDDITTETISSTISSEMRSDAIRSVIIALALMLVYIWFRFSDWRFGVSSVLALLHDVLVVLTTYAILRVSVGSTFIACMLTIVGYSVNATIVIFDRVRENKRLQGGKMDLIPLLDLSISQTMSRSVFTSLTTFFMALTLYIFGVSSIKDFALPMGVGIISGTYSSICLASAFYYILKKASDKKNTKNTAAKKNTAKKKTGKKSTAAVSVSSSSQTEAKPEEKNA